MRAFRAMTTMGFRQVLGLKRVMLLGLFTLLPALVTFTVTNGVISTTAFRRFHEGPFFTLMLLVVPLVALFLGAAPLGDERRDATLSFLLLRPLRRETIVAAKLAAGWLGIALVVGGGAVVTGLVLQFTAGRGEVIVPLVVSVLVAGLGYASVFLLLGYASSRAVVYGAFYVLFWELGLTNAIEALGSVSLSRIGVTVYTDLLPRANTGAVADVLGTLEPGIWGAIAKVAVIAAVAIELGAILLRRRDVT